MEENKIKVYIKVNENNEVINVNSSIFLKDTTGWICIDAGFGDKYAHAQGNYFEKSLVDENTSEYVYKYRDGQVVEEKI